MENSISQNRTAGRAGKFFEKCLRDLSKDVCEIFFFADVVKLFFPHVVGGQIAGVKVPVEGVESPVGVQIPGGRMLRCGYLYLLVLQVFTQ